MTFPPPFKGYILNLFGIAFAASAVYLIASAADLNVFKRAVATTVIVLTGCYVASYIVIYVFHKITSVFILCRKALNMRANLPRP